MLMEVGGKVPGHQNAFLTWFVDGHDTKVQITGKALKQEAPCLHKESDADECCDGDPYSK